MTIHILRARKYVYKVTLIIFILLGQSLNSYYSDWKVFSIGRLKYSGGGDWYSNPSSLPNLAEFIREKYGININKREIIVSFEDESFKKTPVIYFTGHGKIEFNDKEKKNIAWFLKNGGFLFADDNFGMDKYIRNELNSIFPGKKLVEIPFNHAIFQNPFKIKNGAPKIHKHYGGPAKAYGLFLDDKLVAFYAYNTDLGDGWEDLDVHNDGEKKHNEALQMGTNVILYALRQGT
ncbi:MAG: DUF4159 domain-containing protein [Spirochaetia bacterium]|nr:DUF4159 domain-containing protein [Spirochaetia bacterium]